MRAASLETVLGHHRKKNEISNLLGYIFKKCFNPINEDVCDGEFYIFMLLYEGGRGMSE